MDLQDWQKLVDTYDDALENYMNLVAYWKAEGFTAAEINEIQEVQEAYEAKETAWQACQQQAEAVAE